MGGGGVPTAIRRGAERVNGSIESEHPVARAGVASRRSRRSDEGAYGNNGTDEYAKSLHVQPSRCSRVEQLGRHRRFVVVHVAEALTLVQEGSCAAYSVVAPSALFAVIS